MPVNHFAYGTGGPRGPAGVSVPAGVPNLIVESTTLSPTTITASVHVIPSATIRNIGGSDLAGGRPVGLDVTWDFADGSQAQDQVYSDTFTSTITVNGAVVITATGGQAGVNYWVARPAGLYNLTTRVNTLNPPRAIESNYGDNTINQNFTVQATGGGGGGGGGTGGDAVVGTPNSKLVIWGGGNLLTYNVSQYAAFKAAGWGGVVYLTQYPESFGGSQAFRPTTAASQGSNFEHQKGMEGIGGRQSFIVNAHANGWPAYYGVRFQSSDAGNLAAFGYPWSDTTAMNWARDDFGNLAGALFLVGADGMGGDLEGQSGKTWAPTGYTGAGTEAANRGNAYLWGKTMGAAAYAANQDLNMIFYSWYMPGGLAELSDYVNYGFVDSSSTTSLMWNFWHGWMAAHRDANSNGKFYVIDATFYRRADQYIFGASQTAAYKMNNEKPFSWLSNNFSSTVWNHMCDKLYHIPMTFRGSDYTDYLLASQPSDAGHVAMLQYAHEWGMGDRHTEYTYDGDPNSIASYGNRAGSSDYTGATEAAGLIANASTAAIATSTPAFLTGPSKTLLSAGTYKLSAQVKHTYGVRCVQVYDNSTTSVYLGAMQMEWNTGGGFVTTSFMASYQSCSITITGRSVGETIHVVALSARDDRNQESLVL